MDFLFHNRNLPAKCYFMLEISYFTLRVLRVYTPVYLPSFIDCFAKKKFYKYDKEEYVVDVLQLYQ